MFLIVSNRFYIYTKNNYEKYFLKYHLNCFKHNVFVFINFLKRFFEYIRTENLSYKIL